jgi:hypothetical protein
MCIVLDQIGHADWLCLGFGPVHTVSDHDCLTNYRRAVIGETKRADVAQGTISIVFQEEKS